MTRWTNDTDLSRGEVRLLHDLAVLDRALDDDRAPARERLARELGVDVATVLNDIEQVTARAYYQPAGSVDPFTILIDSERIEVDAPQEFTRPVRLNAGEALALGLGLRALALEQGEREHELHELAERLERELSVPEINLQPRLTTSAPANENAPAEINIEQDIAQPWFIAFAPVEDPKVAVAVTTDPCAGCFGGTDAGPIATAVMNEILNGG